MTLSLLKAERKRQGWSQAEIAEALGVSTRTVSRWEQGLVLPHPYYLEQLCSLFGKTAEELDLLPATDDNNVPVADYVHAHNEVLIAQEQSASFVVGNVQVDEQDRQWSTEHPSLIKAVSAFEPFNRFSWRPWGIQSKVLLATLVILVGLLAFNGLLFLRSVLVTRSPETRTIPQIIPTPGPLVLWTTTIDDSVEGSVADQFNYVGNGWQHCPNDQGPCGETPILYNGTNSWDNITGDYVIFTFTGVQIKFYGVLDPQHGIGAVSIDGSRETTLDFYSAQRMGNQLMWTSPMMSAGTHTFKLCVTGEKNTNSSNTFVTVDRVAISS